MKKNEVNKLNYGLYRIYWKEGGYSLAAVGVLHNGDRWLAPTNWTSSHAGGVSFSGRWWKKVLRVELIEKN